MNNKYAVGGALAVGATAAIGYYIWQRYFSEIECPDLSEYSQEYCLSNFQLKKEDFIELCLRFGNMKTIEGRIEKFNEDYSKLQLPKEIKKIINENIKFWEKEISKIRKLVVQIIDYNNKTKIKENIRKVEKYLSQLTNNEISVEKENFQQQGGNFKSKFLIRNDELINCFTLLHCVLCEISFLLKHFENHFSPFFYNITEGYVYKGEWSHDLDAFVDLNNNNNNLNNNIDNNLNNNNDDNNSELNSDNNAEKKCIFAKLNNINNDYHKQNNENNMNNNIDNNNINNNCKNEEKKTNNANNQYKRTKLTSEEINNIKERLKIFFNHKANELLKIQLQKIFRSTNESKKWQFQSAADFLSTQKLKLISSSTQCIFAAKSSLWGNPLHSFDNNNNNINNINNNKNNNNDNDNNINVENNNNNINNNNDNNNNINININDENNNHDNKDNNNNDNKNGEKEGKEENRFERVLEIFKDQSISNHEKIDQFLEIFEYFLPTLPYFIKFGLMSAFEVNYENSSWIDGFVLDFGEGKMGDSANNLSILMTALVIFLNYHDPSARFPSGFERYPVDKYWNNLFLSNSYFVTSFAPCYSPSSSRYSFGSKSTFFLYQPNLSFERNQIPLPILNKPPEYATEEKNYVKINGKKVKNVRVIIEDNFAAKGRDYRELKSKLAIFPDHFVIPESVDDYESFIPWYRNLYKIVSLKQEPNK